MLPRSTYVLKCKNQLYSASIGPKVFAIGFFRKDFAKMVRNQADLHHNLTIIARNQSDVSDDVNDGLVSLGVRTKPYKNVIIDDTAQLRIPKIDPRILNQEEVAVDSVLTEDFLMYPLDRNLGIIMPYDIMENTSRQWNFICQVVHPCYDVDSFVKNIKHTT
jgi:hypothetical protein